MSESQLPGREIVAVARNGKTVYLNAERTNMHLHMLEDPNLLPLVQEAIEVSDFEGDNVAFERDLGRVVGVTNCVETNDSDKIVFAKRKQRNSYSRFVMNREPEPTQSVVVILHKVDGGDYELWSAWCGRLVPMVRDEDGELHGAPSFWAKHALIYEPDLIQPNTLTGETPEKFL